MNIYNLSDLTLKEVLDVIKPLREDWVTRFNIINELRDAVLSVEDLRGATVEPFGSFVSNLFSRWGDLDISIELPNGSYISSAGKKRKQSLLEEVLIALRQKGGWRRLKFISNARVPILKFESVRHRICCDLSVDNLQGQMKSKFLFWISEIDGRFRDMVLLVKEWALAHNINNPKSGTFNSYSLCLLVIFHFQTCVPAILPPLRDLYPGNVADDLIGVRADVERHIAETCAANIARFRSDKSRAVNRSSLRELFISFLAKFSDIGLMASQLGISPFTGKWEEIRNNTRWLPKTYAIFVEDPFEQPENTARAVSARQLPKITETFQMTRNRLLSPNQDKISILATLVRPQVSQFIVRPPPVMYPSHRNGRNFMASSPVQRAPGAPLPVQRAPVANGSSAQNKHRSQNTRQENHPKTSTTPRPVQKNHSQVQQMWRPKSEPKA